jgi:NAD-dependent deacetylase
MSLSKKFLERLHKAYTVVCLTGSGISAASGIPTFRGKDGLWNKYSPHELANMQTFLKQPEVVWEWYHWRRSLVFTAKPNAAHFALAKIEKYYPVFHIITQNVDGLHQRAGSQNVIELHGNIMRNKCIACSYVNEATPEERGVLKCPQCGELLRPDVVWFGELLPEEAITLAQQVSADAEVFFSIGTSSTVEPAASLPFLAKANSAFIVEINPEGTPISNIVDERLSYAVEKSLPALAMIIKKLRKPFIQE